MANYLYGIFLSYSLFYYLDLSHPISIRRFLCSRSCCMLEGQKYKKLFLISEVYSLLNGI